MRTSRTSLKLVAVSYHGHVGTRVAVFAVKLSSFSLLHDSELTWKCSGTDDM